nr:integrin alpha-PS2-like [Procambarus clarkii]
MVWWGVLWAWVWAGAGRGLCFNIETQDIVIHQGPPHSKFGFSVAQHRDTSGPWVLVGAPEANTTQPQVHQGGAVYRCHPTVPATCEPIPFDLTGNHFENGHQMDNKSQQWFGASVASQSGVIVACAPRYVWFSVKKTRREPVGNCFVSTGRDSKAYQMYSPCMTSAWGYHRQGSCQAGFSTTLTQNGNRVYVGAVGSYYWQGQVFYQDLLNRQEALATGEGPKRDDMSYLGYSTAAGDFTGDGEDDLAVGMPRGNDLTGQVVVLDHRLTILYNITGTQVGSYFGYSVAVLDANGDSLVDIAVGAPWYTDPQAAVDFEVGQVTLFAQTPQHNFQRSTRLLGVRSRCHFGLALASLGDINRDGYEDLAVGAPMAGPKGKGGVYIYLGGSDGLASKPSQVILGEEVTLAGAATFGWSLAAGDDLDDNEYPDLVVGAHHAHAAYVFRARPVVQAQAMLKFKSESGIIDLEVLRCSLQDSTEVPCVSLQYCLTYTGHRVPSTLQMKVWLRVDTRAELVPRMFFLHREGEAAENVTLELRKSVERCTTLYTYLTREPQDKLTPLVAEMTSDLLEETGDLRPPSLSPPRRPLRPILAPPHLHPSSTSSALIYIKNNCGGDNVCVPNLSLSVDMAAGEYVLGSRENLVARVRVHNSGEDAFLAKVVVKVPRGATFSRFLLTEDTSDDLTPICSSTTKAGVEEVICDLGNPLPSGAGVGLQLVFQPTPLLLNHTSLDFHLRASSANPEDPAHAHDNHVALALPVTLRSDINIKGISFPDEPFDYNASQYGVGLVGEGGRVTHERQVGPEVMHVYDLTNRGPSDLPAAHIFLLWPTRTLAYDPLLYLLDPPSVSAPARCQPFHDVNYLGLQVEDASSRLQHLVGTSAGDDRPHRRPEHTDEVLNDQPVDGESSNQLHRHRRHSRHHHHPLQEERGRRSGRRSERESLQKELSCGPTNCTRVVCSIAPLRASDSIVVRVRSRLWVDTIQKVGMPEVKISSRLVVVAAPEGGDPGDWWLQGDAGDGESPEGEGSGGGVERSVWSRTVTTVVRTGPEEHRSSLKWLVVVGSILAGLLLLALLSLLLWAMGFFKRRRPQDKTETEPLNTNGFYGNGNS